MSNDVLLWIMLIVPAVAGGLCLLLPTPRTVLACVTAGVLAAAVAAASVARSVFTGGPILGAYGWLYLDALSAYHLLVMMAVFTLSSVYAWSYFGHEIRAGHLTLRQARRYGALWSCALPTMALVLISNNLGIMWVGMEGTTLLTAFLICVHVSPTSLEAMWKYLVICSVGVGFAFMGTLLVAASAHPLHLDAAQTLLWTKLRAGAPSLNPLLLKAGFLFLLVGYGTKAGLAPMHSWLPDAHSQAPAPVSAIFSGFMLNAALYCVMRYVPLVEAATGFSGWSLSLLAGFGVLSILVAAAFIVFQHDLKRLLAYHSVEHLGIISLGLGLGGLGTFAALFHTLNHSLCKTLAFFAAGRLGQISGTHDMTKMTGTLRTSPVWGLGLFGSILALIGVAPFALFMSEFQILKAAFDRGSIITLVLFLLGAGVVFVGALGHAIHVAWGEAPEAGGEGEAPAEPPLHAVDGSAGASPSRDQDVRHKASLIELGLVLLPLAVLLTLGLWMPHSLRMALDSAAQILRGTP